MRQGSLETLSPSSPLVFLLNSTLLCPSLTPLPPQAFLCFAARKSKSQHDFLSGFHFDSNMLSLRAAAASCLLALFILMRQNETRRFPPPLLLNTVLCTYHLMLVSKFSSTALEIHSAFSILLPGNVATCGRKHFSMCQVLITQHHTHIHTCATTDTHTCAPYTQTYGLIFTRLQVNFTGSLKDKNKFNFTGCLKGRFEDSFVCVFQNK